MVRFLLPALVLLSLSEARARPWRPAQVPNGSVHNCTLCHTRPAGGGPLNSFGEAVDALLALGSRAPFWSPALAATDSDGDGFPNGEELGDPDGDGAPESTGGITHPGDPASFPQTPAPAIPDAADIGLERLLVRHDLPGGGRVIDAAPVGADTFAVLTLDPVRTLLQPGEGNEAATLSAIFTDAGLPWTGSPLPGRIAGDARSGAVRFATGTAALLHTLPEFASDDRWDTGLLRPPETPTDVVQFFGTGIGRSVSKAVDVLGGRLAQGALPADPRDRFAGDLAFLEDGVLAVALEDRSGLRGEGPRLIALGLAPDGSALGPVQVVESGAGIPELAAFRGGVCIRRGNRIHFLDGTGNRQGHLDIDLPLEGERHMAAHIGHSRIFVAGGTGPLHLMVIDAVERTVLSRHFVNEVSPAGGGHDEGDLEGVFGALDLATDSSGRVAVAFEWRAEADDETQVLVRILEHADGEWTAITPSFRAMDAAGPSIALGRRTILVGAGGYTLIRRPDPLPEAEPPGPVVLSSVADGDGLRLSRTGGLGPFEWQSKARVDAAGWRTLGLSTEGSFRLVPEGPAGFLRVVDWGLDP